MIAPSTAIPPDMVGTRTAVAGAIYKTQTAAPPLATALPTRTPWPTPVPTITNTPKNTPLPTVPTATLEPGDIPTLILCYQAAQSVYADWEAYIKIITDHGWFGYSDALGNALYRFRNERKYRVVTYFDDPDILGDDKLLIKGVNLLEEPVCDPYAVDIYVVSWAIDTYNPWGVGSRERITFHNGVVERVSKTIRKGLINVYGISETDLDAIDAPIWQNVVNRYGVVIPVY